jgi:peptidoglycan hydrolase-like protein with peptidoglycan-binding domain
MENPEVTILQTFLISQGLLPVGSAIGYFGPKTEAALQAYQKREGIVSSGSPATTGYGSLGPTTRVRINAQMGGGTGLVTTPAPTPVPKGKGVVITRLLYKGLSGPDTVLLQNYLIGKKYLGTGNNSGFFGVLTEAAVKAFQKDNGLEQVGSVGPKTRQYLGEGR